MSFFKGLAQTESTKLRLTKHILQNFADAMEKVEQEDTEISLCAQARWHDGAAVTGGTAAGALEACRRMRAVSSQLLSSWSIAWICISPRRSGLA